MNAQTTAAAYAYDLTSVLSKHRLQSQHLLGQAGFLESPLASGIRPLRSAHAKVNVKVLKPYDIYKIDHTLAKKHF